MRKKTGVNQYFKVLLDKKIPMQAGLGGGSGNAATAMHAFNVLCNFPAKTTDLETWSGEIGSDITFFFSSGTAYCTGYQMIYISICIYMLKLYVYMIIHIYVYKENNNI